VLAVRPVLMVNATPSSSAVDGGCEDVGIGSERVEADWLGHEISDVGEGRDCNADLWASKLRAWEVGRDLVGEART